MRPKLLMSTCSNSPGRARSYRRTGSGGATRQTPEAVAAQHSAHRRARDADPLRNRQAREPLAPQLHDARFAPARGPPRTAPRGRGAIVEPGDAVRPIPCPPLLDRPRAHPGSRCGLLDRPPVGVHPLHDESSRLRRRPRVTVQPHPGSPSCGFEIRFATISLPQEVPGEQRVWPLQLATERNSSCRCEEIAECEARSDSRRQRR